ncbi:MAG: hypothetical protein ABF242_00215 [Flavobacteriales bacterium]
MKFIITLLILVSYSLGFSQDAIKQTDTTEKVILISPLPISIYNELKNNGSGIEVTMYNSSKTFTLPKLAGVHYLLSFIEGKATLDFNKTTDAYVMILARDDFYMDAEVSITAKSAYIVFKKDGEKYYNKLNENGIKFFRKFMLPAKTKEVENKEPGSKN